MLNFLDTSNWQGGYDPALTGADAVIVKATQASWFVDEYCDSIVQQCKQKNIPWGFYHYAYDGDPVVEADYFINNTLNYFKKGIPVLDWEGVYDEDGNLIFDQSVEWVNAFVERVHERTNVWPWIYANPWRFNQGGVNPNCARWVADYPEVVSPTWEQARNWDCPEADGNVVAWQFCSDGHVNSIDGNVDLNLFYGTTDQWRAYAFGDNKLPDDSVDSGTGNGTGNAASNVMLENEEYKVTIERKQ